VKKGDKKKKKKNESGVGAGGSNPAFSDMGPGMQESLVNAGISIRIVPAEGESAAGASTKPAPSAKGKRKRTALEGSRQHEHAF